MEYLKNYEWRRLEDELDWRENQAHQASGKLTDLFCGVVCVLATVVALIILMILVF